MLTATVNDAAGAACAVPAGTSESRHWRDRRAGRAIGCGISLVTFVLATCCVVLLIAVLGAQYLFGFEAFVEKSDSMSPVMWTGDVVFLRAIDVEEASVGDIIAFKRPKSDEIILHRLLVKEPIHADPNRKTGPILKWDMRTKGDAAGAWDDPWQIRAGGDLKEFYLAVPKVGYVMHYIKTPWVLGALLGIGTIFVLALVLHALTPPPTPPRDRAASTDTGAAALNEEAARTSVASRTTAGR